MGGNRPIQPDRPNWRDGRRRQRGSRQAVTGHLPWTVPEITDQARAVGRASVPAPIFAANRPPPEEDQMVRTMRQSGRIMQW
jgi:hypothetical protein